MSNAADQLTKRLRGFAQRWRQMGRMHSTDPESCWRLLKVGVENGVFDSDLELKDRLSESLNKVNPQLIDGIKNGINPWGGWNTLFNYIGLRCLMPNRQVKSGGILGTVEQAELFADFIAQLPTDSPPASVETAKPATQDVDDDAMLAPRRLAEIFQLPYNALRRRLNNWRATNASGWLENSDRTPRDAMYFYRVGSIRHIISNLKNGQRTASEKILTP